MYKLLSNKSACIQLLSTSGSNPDIQFPVTYSLPLPLWLKTIPAFGLIKYNSYLNWLIVVFMYVCVCVEDKHRFSTRPCIIPHLLEKDESDRGFVSLPLPSDKKKSSGFFPAESCSLLPRYHGAHTAGETMSLLLENQFKELPPDKAVDTKLFLEAVSHIPSFIGEYTSTWTPLKTVFFLEGAVLMSLSRFILVPHDTFKWLVSSWDISHIPEVLLLLGQPSQLRRFSL